MWNCLIRISAAVGKPTKAIWTSCLSPCRAACLKSCGNSTQSFTRIKNSLLSLEGFTDGGGNVIDFIADEAVDVVETVVHAVMMDRLKVALSLLSDGEQALVKAILFEELSEREVGLRLGMTQSVVNKRKAKILAKLRTIIEN